VSKLKLKLRNRHVVTPTYINKECNLDFSVIIYKTYHKPAYIYSVNKQNPSKSNKDKLQAKQRVLRESMDDRLR